MAERRGAPGAYPAITTVMLFGLFFEALGKRLHQFVPAAERFDLSLLFVGQGVLVGKLQPFIGDALG